MMEKIDSQKEVSEETSTDSNDGNDSHDSNDSHDAMSFLDHLEELRVRLIKIILSLIAGMSVCWIFRENIRAFLEAPLFIAWSQVPGLPPLSPLSFKNLMEPFVAYLKLSAIGGVFLSSPVIFYHLWKFIAPGLYKKEKKMVFPFVSISSLLFITGSLGAYIYVFPIGFSFFLQFSAGADVDYLTANVQPAKIESVKVAVKVKDKKTAPDKNEATAKKSLVKNAAGKKKSAVKKQSRQTSAWIKAKQAYTWLEENITGSACSDFSAKRDKQNKREIILEYRYNTVHCQDPPNDFFLHKSDSKNKIKLKKAGIVKGWQIYKAKDSLPVTKNEQYTLETYSNGSKKLIPVLMVKDYLDFAVKLLLAFGLVFELPILIFFLAYAQIVDYVQLIKFGRWFIVLSVVLAAILTPPDVVTQLLLAAPLIFLYYISILVVFIMNKTEKK
ncbi:MAG: twin-arginine translocase subunit TatC [Deltaproteobacteria bacterium]|nr:twin-arginine translocase subunit TatC [Deltaproteobacteria bacterium]